jgi:amino acid transporter
MLTNFVYLVVAASIVFVYYDTTKNKIGKIPDEKGFLNLSPALWAIATWLLWIVAFPLYLMNRAKLIEKAKEKPQEVSDKRRKIVLCILGGIAVLVFLNFILSIGGGKSNLEKAAMPVVTQIFQKQFGIASAECVKVELGEEFADNNYHAVATMSTGNTVKITIQVKGDQIYVQIPYDQ